MFLVKYLSLRGSSFVDFEPENLLSLEFIDIRGTKIKNLNLKKCVHLKLVVADPHQLVLVNDGV